MSDANVDDETYEPKILSTQGRIGRLRYIAYSGFLAMALAFFIGIAAAIVIPMVAKRIGSGAGLGPAISFLFILYVPIIVIIFVMAKRRLNDLEHSGWLSLLLLVPLVNFFMWLYLMFFPGSEGANKYGPKPIKNSVPVIIFGGIIPILFIAGMMSALSTGMSAYKTYQMRVKAAQAAHSVPAPDTVNQAQ